jgi:hypothetical protein
MLCRSGVYAYKTRPNPFVFFFFAVIPNRLRVFTFCLFLFFAVIRPVEKYYGHFAANMAPAAS